MVQAYWVPPYDPDQKYVIFSKIRKISLFKVEDLVFSRGI